MNLKLSEIQTRIQQNLNDLEGSVVYKVLVTEIDKTSYSHHYYNFRIDIVSHNFSMEFNESKSGCSILLISKYIFGTASKIIFPIIAKVLHQTWGISNFITTQGLLISDKSKTLLNIGFELIDFHHNYHHRKTIDITKYTFNSHDIQGIFSYKPVKEVNQKFTLNDIIEKIIKKP